MAMEAETSPSIIPDARMAARMIASVLRGRDTNGERKRACEIMQFDASGRQIRGEALYGAII
jgi:hypothetical protein